MNDLYLTRREKALLFFMRFKKKVKPRFDASHLVNCGLIAQNLSDKRNQHGVRYPLDTFSLTERELRWRIAVREDRWKRIVTPITVTILTNAALAGIQWLWQWLQELP